MKINRHLETGNLMITDPCYLHQQNHFQCQDLPAPMRVGFCQFVICKGGGFIRVVRTAVSAGLWIRLQDLINWLSLTASSLLLGPRPIISTCLVSRGSEAEGFVLPTSGQHHFKVYAKVKQ